MQRSFSLITLNYINLLARYHNRMLHGLLLEYTGTLLIIAAVLYTHANPIMVGLAYMAALFIADGKSEGYFNPLGGLVQYMLGRLSPDTFVKLLVVQILAAFSMNSPPRTRIPLRAALANALSVAAGVEMTSAHGLRPTNRISEK